LGLRGWRTKNEEDTRHQGQDRERFDFHISRLKALQASSCFIPSKP
jgi:hypothetical protein